MGKLGWDVERGSGLWSLSVSMRVCVWGEAAACVYKASVRAAATPLLQNVGHIARGTLPMMTMIKKKGGAVHRGAVAMRRAFSGSGRLNRLVTRSGGSPGYFVLVLSCASLRARMGCGPFQPGCLALMVLTRATSGPVVVDGESFLDALFSSAGQG